VRLKGAWAQTQALEEVYGLSADALNDDRIGRALDEIHPHLVDLWATLVLRGAQSYGLRLDQLHSDVTRVAFEGAYEDAPATTADGQPPPRITHGFTGKEDPSRKQVTLSRHRSGHLHAVRWDAVQPHRCAPGAGRPRTRGWGLRTCSRASA
jgi:hypothetical protein